MLTPSEVQYSYTEDTAVRLVPPAAWVPLELYTAPRDQGYRVATGAEARPRKRKGLIIEADGWKGAKRLEGEGEPD